MAKQDVRWVQRFSNFREALEKLRSGAGEFDEDMSDLEKEGLIHRFQHAFEMAWKTLEDLLAFKGYVNVKGPNPVLEQALRDGYIQKEKAWRRMNEARNLKSHTYVEGAAEELVTKIVKEYVGLLSELMKVLEKEEKKS